ncbi:hypothetical protein [Myroides]|uniref:Uncharacterized protein n=1 Tax=Myroides indicus TaxID=1323422 RepID=A0A4R7F828_9FLAO|nr:hypothetical protein [Myroides]APA93456.1 hypothetical protein BK054_14720 [Myroides sp. ZB35]MDM1035324.1 hypothetical protein [Myroides odoratimimus]MDM1462022.1 hypothetical protein [Myroides odoratimimus]TDS64397.1 hypothetical protein C8P70_104115 [Myroides indicus]
MTEHQIQTYLWENRERWEELIDYIEFPEKYSFDKDDEAIYERTPEKVLFNEIVDRYSRLYNNLFGLRLFGCEVPLKREGDSTIRADLLGLIEGVSGVAIVEIKKSAQTERQAFTELFAYASHLQAIFPTMTNEDIHYILISPMQERIVREAAISSFLFDEKPVFAYIPTYENDDVNTIRLKPWIPTITDIIKITESAFSQKNFEIFKVTWDEIEDWNAKKHENPSDYMIERMNRISSYATQLMESKRIHGFVFTSQGYPELPYLNNAITLAGLNPFKIAKDNYLITENNISPHKLDEISDDEIKLTQIIPELLNKVKEANEQNEFFYDLVSTWDNTLCGIAFETIKTMTTNDKGLKFERGWGGMTWKQYQGIMLEDALCFNYDIKPTGLIRKLFISYSVEDYKYMEKFGTEKHPYLNHGDVPDFMVDYINQQIYFRDFLYNIFESYKDIYEEFDKD